MAQQSNTTGSEETFPDLARIVRETLLSSTGKTSLDGMSLRQLGRRSGVSHTTLGALLAGTRVSPYTLERFARAYNMSPNPFLVAMGEKPLQTGINAHSSRPAPFVMDEIKLADGRRVTIEGFDVPREDKEIVKSLIRRLMKPT